jgi:hypothetical protein
MMRRVRKMIVKQEERKKYKYLTNFGEITIRILN